MRIAIISCWNYRDAWPPFKALLEGFWRDSEQYDIDVISDTPEQPETWCRLLNAYVTVFPSEPILLMQEDFFITAPVNQPLIDHALEQMNVQNAGCVRLYPCPGGITDYGDPYFSIVPRGTPYRISCQAAIWKPSYLRQVTMACGDTPVDFELRGTPLADLLDDEVLAFKRDVRPWPIEYLCSAISRGKWNPDAKRLCDRLGIEVDWSLRQFASA